MQTTLKKLRAAHACTKRYAFLRKALGANYGYSTPITMTQILDLNGINDCIWAISNTQGENGAKLLRLFACDCAEKVLPIFESQYPNDTRVRDCIVVARRFANGNATIGELNKANTASYAASYAAAAASYADAAAAAAADAAYAASYAADADAAAAADAAYAASYAAADAAYAARGWQIDHLRQLLTELRARPTLE